MLSIMVPRPSIGLVAPLLWFIFHSPAPAQMNMANHVMEMQDETPPEQLPPPRRIAGVGNAYMDVTAKPEAKMWFEQGLNLLHDFWDYESARAFEQSVRVDPACAMCFWGLYEAESFYHGTAQDYAGQALASAVRLEGRASKRERLYIEATAIHQQALTNPMPPGPAFARELGVWRKLVREYPKDRQARIFLAQRAGGKEALEIYEGIFSEAPDDSAANHYYIHALEASDHPERALHSAEILARLAPASGHMVHMPGHIFFRMGDYARAEHAFAESLEVDERYMRDQHVEPDNDWNYVHNLMYAIANLMEEGKFAQADALSAKLNGARGKLDSTLYTAAARDSISRLDSHLPVALRIGDWARVLRLLESVKPPAGRPNLDFLAAQLSLFADAMGAVEAHDLVRAQASSTRFDAELWRTTQQFRDAQPMKMAANSHKMEVMPDALMQPLLSTLAIMSLELRASVLTIQQKTEDAKALFARAAQEEKALGYREPPNYIRPVGETEGAAMTAAGAWADAAAAYKRALVERPHSGLPLYGIALSSEKAGNTGAAAKEYAEFLAAWKDGDATLPQIAHAKEYIAAH